MSLFTRIEDNTRVMLLGIVDMIAPATQDEWDERLRNAVEAGLKTLAQKSLEHGAEAEQVIYYGARRAPLLVVAAERGHADVVALLVQNGATINAKDTFGDTAVVKAVENDWPKVVAKLADRGAEVNFINANGQSLLDRALATYAHDIAGVLRNHGGKLSSQLNAVAGRQQARGGMIASPGVAIAVKP